MPLAQIKIGQTPWYNIDPVSKTMQMADSCYDGYIDEAGSVKRRNGLKRWAITGISGKGQGLFYWSQYDCIIAVSGGKVFKISKEEAITEMTGVSLNNRPVVFADGNKTDGSPWLYMADGGQLIYTQGEVLARMNNSGSPSSCSHVAWLASRFIANQSGTRKFYATDTNPATGLIEPDYWADPLQTYAAETGPDLLEAVFSSWGELLVWGSQGLEIWRADDIGLSPQQGAFTPVGLAAKYSIAEADNTIFALGLVDSGRKRAVIKMEGRNPRVVSLPIERLLNSYERIDDAIGFCTADSQYILTFPSEGVTWAYDYARDKWYPYSKWNALYANREDFLGCYCVSAWGKTLMQSRVDGTIYQFDSSTYQDDGTEINTEYVTGNIDHGTGSIKKNNFLRLRMKRGNAAGTNNIMLRWLNNGELAYQNVNQKLVSLGAEGERDSSIKVFGTGLYRSRQYSISITDNSELILVGIEEDATVLAR